MIGFKDLVSRSSFQAHGMLWQAQRFAVEDADALIGFFVSTGRLISWA